MKHVLLSFLLSFCLFACQKEEEHKQKVLEPIAEGRSFNAAFLMIDGVYNSELMAPYDIFQHTIFHTEGGINVFTVAENLNPITSFEGLKIMPDYSFKSTDLPEIDILVVPSAEHNMGADLENSDLIAWVEKVGTKAEYVISLCDGAFVLAKAGLVKGKESTTFPSDIEQYKKTFPSLTVHSNVSFVHDGALLTSAGGAKSYDVALYLVHLLYGDQVAKGVGRGLVIDWNIEDYSYIQVN